MPEDQEEQVETGEPQETFVQDFVPPGEVRLRLEGYAETAEPLAGLSMSIRSVRTGDCEYCTVSGALWEGRMEGSAIYLCKACFDQQFFAGADKTNIPPIDFIDIVNDDR